MSDIDVRTRMARELGEQDAEIARLTEALRQAEALIASQRVELKGMQARLTQHESQHGSV